MEQKSDLTLRIDPNKLKDFVSSLLGQRRTIEQKFSGGRFSVDHAWLENLFRVCEQRLAQHEYALIGFKGDFYFRGGRVYKVESHEAFVAYTDMSTEESLGVDLMLTYLISFPGIETPEKQELRLEIFSDYSIKDKVESDGEIPIIRYSVRFTNLTWGEDISRHLNAYIEQNRKNSFFQRMVEYGLNTPVGMILALVLSFGAFVLFIGGPDPLVKQTRNEFQQLIGAADFASISKKLDLLGQHFILPSSDGSKIFMIPLLIMAVVFALATTGRFIPRLFPSFVILNKKTADKARRAETRLEYIKWSIYVALAVGVLASLFAARVDHYLFPAA